MKKHQNSAPDLVVLMTKRADGGAVLRCVRADGTECWQRQEGKQAAFFPLHDLTHYAVESVLGYRRGFFGLIAEGWDIPDTEGKGLRGPLPIDAKLIEQVVGFLDVERASGARWSAEEFNEQSRAFAADRGLAARASLSDDELQRIRAMRADLFARWSALPASDTLRLEFERAAPDP